jgi:hypothetical protein
MTTEHHPTTPRAQMEDAVGRTLATLDAIRAGAEMGPATTVSALLDVRTLRGYLEALEAELILYGREPSATGRPRVTLRDIAGALQLHHSTVAERHVRLVSGDVPADRAWLISGTAREQAPAPAAQPPTDCIACGRLFLPEDPPFVLEDGEHRIHRSHTTDPQSGYYGATGEAG